MADRFLAAGFSEDDAFAVSVATGKILWTYKSGISQEISTVCCGWLNRGVAIRGGC